MKSIQVYEHREYKVGKPIGNIIFQPEHLKKLQEFHGKNGRLYNLVNNGVKFCEYVGVLKVGDLVIEVLPKMDGKDANETIWQEFLINMLRTSGIMDIEQTGFSSLKLKSNSILDLYMELFLKEVKYLIHTGLVKKYHETEENSFTMKGSLVFNRNIQQNLTHAERFYVRHCIYYKDNIFNSLLLKTTKLISRIGRPPISAAAKGILLDLPDCKDIHVNEAVFSKLVYSRKTEGYRKALNITKLLLLNYHPDIRNGRDDVLALMFDMNELWEKYVFKSLRKELYKKFPEKYIVKEQVINHFWKPANGHIRKVRPDIVVYDSNLPKNVIAVFDTKWKNLLNNKPDDADLKQMLVYNLYNNAKESALVYPSNITRDVITGTFQKDDNGNCSLMFLPLSINKNKMGIALDSIIAFIETHYPKQITLLKF